LIVATVTSPAIAGEVSGFVKLPPVSNDPGRCERGFVGNTIGQANGVSGDKALDVRYCEFPGADLKEVNFSAAFMSEANFKGANLQQAVISKVYATKSNFEGADFTNAVLDRSDMTDANFKNAKFVNAVITGVDFSGSDLSGADFEDALVGSEDSKRLCLNPTLVGEARYQVGCRK